MNWQRNKILFTTLKQSFLIWFLLSILACNGTEKKYSDELQVFPVFTEGTEPVLGYQDRKYAQFREQNITVTNSGKIVVIVQGRNASNWSDRSGQDHMPVFGFSVAIYRCR